jgi:hypothetical protein
MSKMSYGRLFLMAVLPFLSMYVPSMYVLMYAMVNTFTNVYANLNQVYMAGLMAAPMVVIELALMGAMYPDRKRNVVIMAISLVALATFWIGDRPQRGRKAKVLLGTAGQKWPLLASGPDHPKYRSFSGVGEIRTHGPVARSAVFKTAALNHSATTPRAQKLLCHSKLRKRGEASLACR